MVVRHRRYRKVVLRTYRMWLYQDYALNVLAKRYGTTKTQLLRIILDIGLRILWEKAFGSSKPYPPEPEEMGI